MAEFLRVLSTWLVTWGNLLATTAVAVATIVYVVLTHRLASSAERSASSAAAAARSAGESADAAKKGLELTRATLPLVEFQLDLMHVIPVAWASLILRCRGARVYIHELELDSLVLQNATDSWQVLGSAFSLKVADPLPRLMHPGVPLVCNFDLVDHTVGYDHSLPWDISSALVTVSFSYGPDEERYQIPVYGHREPIGDGGREGAPPRRDA